MGPARIVRFRNFELTWNIVISLAVLRICCVFEIRISALAYGISKQCILFELNIGHDYLCYYCVVILWIFRAFIFFHVLYYFLHEVLHLPRDLLPGSCSYFDNIL